MIAKLISTGPKVIRIIKGNRSNVIKEGPLHIQDKDQNKVLS